VMQHPPSQNPAAETIPGGAFHWTNELESQRGWSGSLPCAGTCRIIWRWFSIVPWTLSRAWYTGTVPIGTGGVDDGGADFIQVAPRGRSGIGSIFHR